VIAPLRTSLGTSSTLRRQRPEIDLIASGPDASVILICVVVGSSDVAKGITVFEWNVESRALLFVPRKQHERAPARDLIFQVSGDGSSFVSFTHDKLQEAESVGCAWIPLSGGGAGFRKIF
jgi:hypothetical protein